MERLAVHLLLSGLYLVGFELKWELFGLFAPVFDGLLELFELLSRRIARDLVAFLGNELVDEPA